MMDSNQNMINYKYVLLGDSSVGKVNLFKKKTTGVFSDKSISTIGMDKRTIYQINIDIEDFNYSQFNLNLFHK